MPLPYTPCPTPAPLKICFWKVSLFLKFQGWQVWSWWDNVISNWCNREMPAMPELNFESIDMEYDDSNQDIRRGILAIIKVKVKDHWLSLTWREWNLSSAFDPSPGEQWAATVQRSGIIWWICPPFQPFMLSAKQGGNGSHFINGLWFDPTGNRTPVSRVQGGLPGAGRAP